MFLCLEIHINNILQCKAQEEQQQQMRHPKGGFNRTLYGIFSCWDCQRLVAVARSRLEFWPSREVPGTQGNSNCLIHILRGQKSKQWKWTGSARKWGELGLCLAGIAFPPTLTWGAGDRSISLACWGVVVTWFFIPCT